MFVGKKGNEYKPYAIDGRSNIQSFISYTKNFTRPIGQLAQVSNMIQSTIAACERVFEFLDSPEEEKEKVKKYDISKIKERNYRRKK